MRNTRSLVLAAGLGTRMKSDLPKVLHRIGGEPLVLYVIRALKQAGVDDIGVVVGYRRELVEQALRDEEVEFIFQAEQKGTGHAVQVSRAFIEKKTGTLLVLPGDVPLIDAEILKALAEFHEKEKAAATVLSMEPPDPAGYGRIVRGNGKAGGDFVRIREEKDASEPERKITEVNTGIYAFEAAALMSVLDAIDNDNAQDEFYITDAPGRLASAGKKVAVLKNEGDSARVQGVNTAVELARIETIVRGKGK